MNFDVGKHHILAAILIGVGVGGLQYHCDSRQQIDEQADVEEAAVELSPEERLAQLDARDAVQDAHERGLRAAMRDVNRRLRKLKRDEEASAPDPADSEAITLLFSANIHGEREDCGCKSNPLGGLARRQTLVELAATPDSEEAVQWWGDSFPSTDARFQVDAGDLLFRSSSLDRQPERMQNQAARDAEAVVEALEVDAPDAVNVGELDLALGLDTYTKLVADSKLPVISANLMDSDGKRVFDGHRVVERGSKKVAFVGVLKEKGRDADYYESRGARVASPSEAYMAELEELPDKIDAVVLLSNLGAPRTAELVETIKARRGRLDAAIVSNTNQLTRTPQWAASVPIVEPMSRGKYFGRLDLLLGDEPGISYANAVTDPREAIQKYRRAWTRYLGATKQLREAAREVAELQKRLESQSERARQSDRQAAEASATASGPDDGDKGDGRSEEGAAAEDRTRGEAEKFVDSSNAELESRVEFLQKKIGTLHKRADAASKAVARETAGIPTLEGLVAPTEGDDWATVRIAQLELDIPQQAQVREVLDRKSNEEKGVK